MEEEIAKNPRLILDMENPTIELWKVAPSDEIIERALTSSPWAVVQMDKPSLKWCLFAAKKMEIDHIVDSERMLKLHFATNNPQAVFTPRPYDKTNVVEIDFDDDTEMLFRMKYS